MNAAGFDLWADGYDRAVRVSDEENSYPFAGYKRVLGEVYARVRECGARSVLDVGVGTGVLAGRLYADGLTVTGVDFSAVMLDKARARMPGAALYQADFARGLPEAVLKGRYDAIVSTYALHHVSDERKAELLRTLFGLLAPGGVLLVGDIAFETVRAQDDLRESLGGEWDEEEFYLNYGDFSARLAVPSQYSQISICAGVLVLKKPRVVFFDYGNTLAFFEDIDFARGHAALLAHAVENPRGATARDIAATSEGFFEELRPQLLEPRAELREDGLMRFAHAWHGVAYDLSEPEQEFILWQSAAPSTPAPGIGALLAALRAQGIETAVISNHCFCGEALARSIGALLPGHAFARVMSSADYLLRKPDARLFQLALRLLDVSAADAWHCGDLFAADVEGALAAGITPIWYGRDADQAALPAGRAIHNWDRLTAWLA